jgi:hypothetical protein
LNTKAIGNGPMTNDTSTSTGATNRAIWAPDPTAMLTAAHARPADRGLPGGLYGEHRTVDVVQDLLGGAAGEEFSHRVAGSQADDDEFDR